LAVLCLLQAELQGVDADTLDEVFTLLGYQENGIRSPSSLTRAKMRGEFEAVT
jgi:hypothetical protein